MKEGKELANIKRNPPAEKRAGPPPSPNVDPRKIAFDEAINEFRDGIVRVLQEHIEMIREAIDEEEKRDD